MRVEAEPKRLRQSEVSSRLWGDVSSAPFPKALHELAVSRGYESQRALVRAIRVESSSSVSQWIRGENVPSPECFGALLVLLRPNQGELERLVLPYSELLRIGKGGVVRDTEIQLKRSAMQVGVRETPFGEWIENFCKKKKVTFRRVAESLGFSSNFFTNRDLLGISALAIILQCLPKRYNLGDDEVEDLCESITKTIVGKISNGHQFLESGRFGPHMKRRSPKY